MHILNTIGLYTLKRWIDYVSYSLIKLSKTQKETEYGVEIINSEPHCCVMAVGCLGEPPRQHLQALSRLHSPEKSLTLLFAKCSLPDNVLVVRRRAGMGMCATPPQETHCPVSVMFPFKCAGSFWARDTLTFYYKKIQRFTKVERTVQWTPLFPSPRFTSDHFMDLFISSVSSNSYPRLF